MKAKNYAARKKAANWIVILIIFVVAVLMLIPFLWMISTSLRPASESMKLPPSFLPTQFEYGNYLELFQSSIPFLNLFGNSIFVTVIVTAAQLIMFYCRLQLCPAEFSRKKYYFWNSALYADGADPGDDYPSVYWNEQRKPDGYPAFHHSSLSHQYFRDFPDEAVFCHPAQRAGGFCEN